MQQPKMLVLATNEIYAVASLVRLDNWSTLRAFPLKDIEPGEAYSYVIVKWEWEDTEVWAELIFETK